MNQAAAMGNIRRQYAREFLLELHSFIIAFQLFKSACIQLYAKIG